MLGARAPFIIRACRKARPRCRQDARGPRLNRIDILDLVLYRYPWGRDTSRPFLNRFHQHLFRRGSHHGELALSRMKLEYIETLWILRMTKKLFPALVLLALAFCCTSPVISANLEGQVEQDTSADDSALQGSSTHTELNGNANSKAELKTDGASLRIKRPADDQPAKMLQGGAVGGEATIGCLGANFTNDGMLRIIYPPSDLNRFGIAPGDRILSINGEKWPGMHKFQRKCLGLPGTVMTLGILHNGQAQLYEVRRISSRELVQYGGGYYSQYANKYVTW
jgi:hypothetical protein